MEQKRPLRSIPDDELLCRLAELMQRSRRVESDLVAHISEVDERRLYAREAPPSMFAYCTEVLHLSEAEAYLRIAAARASRQHPMLLTMLGDGRLHLTGIAKLAPYLTRENRDGAPEASHLQVQASDRIRLMCHAHNQYVAEHDYGRKAMARHRRSDEGVAEAVVYSTGSTSTVKPSGRHPSPVQ